MSIVSRVLDVQFTKSPLEKSSAKIAAAAEVTRIGADATLFALGFASESTASTVYVCVVPGVSPGSVNVVEVVDPTGVAPPSRYTRYVIGGDASVDADHVIWIVPTDGLDPLGWPGIVGGVVSGAWFSPGAVSIRTLSKLTVKVFAAVSPIWTRPIAVVPVFVAQAFTILTPSR